MLVTQEPDIIKECELVVDTQEQFAKEKLWEVSTIQELKINEDMGIIVDT